MAPRVQTFGFPAALDRRQPSVTAGNRRVFGRRTVQADVQHPWRSRSYLFDEPARARWVQPRPLTPPIPRALPLFPPCPSDRWRDALINSLKVSFLSDRWRDALINSLKVSFSLIPNRLSSCCASDSSRRTATRVHALCVLPCPPGTQRRLARDERLAAAGRVAPPSEPLEPFRGGRLTSERYITPPPAP